MKIEKITENKIRIILKQEDFKDHTVDIQKLLLTSTESHSLFLEILNKAKNEVNFDTDGHKLLIEAFFESEDVFIFTITKYIEKNNNPSKPKKYLTIKRKYQICNNTSNIYQFNTFDDFCNFCNFINKNLNLKGLFKKSSLYYYNTYYLVLDGINLKHVSLEPFNSIIYEFANFSANSKNFKFKLIEHAKIIIKNNAITTTIKYFSTQ